LIQGAGELVAVELVLAEVAVLGAEDLVAGFEAVWALAAAVAAAKIRARTKRFMAGPIWSYIPNGSLSGRGGLREAFVVANMWL
jgi:hypothetical protein